VEPSAIRVGTLSKALGSQGGFVVGSRTLIEWMWNKSRTQVFSTALSPACCAAAHMALEIIAARPELRADLHERSELLRNELRAGGVVPLEGSTFRYWSAMRGGRCRSHDRWKRRDFWSARSVRRRFHAERHGCGSR